MSDTAVAPQEELALNADQVHKVLTLVIDTLSQRYVAFNQSYRKILSKCFHIIDEASKRIEGDEYLLPTLLSYAFGYPDLVQRLLAASGMPLPVGPDASELKVLMNLQRSSKMFREHGQVYFKHMHKEHYLMRVLQREVKEAVLSNRRFLHSLEAVVFAAKAIDFIDEILQNRNRRDEIEMEELNPLRVTDPLVFVIKYGYTAIARCLLNFGLDPNISKRDTALIHACNQGDVDILQMLVEHGADLNVVCNDGNPPLVVACYYGHLHIVQHLLALGVDPNVGSKAENFTPLMQASHRGQIEIMGALLSSGADPDALSRGGRSALYYASRSSEEDAVRMLLHFADPNAGGEGIVTPLMMAVERGDKDTVDQFIAVGADVNRELKNEYLRDNGKTALIMACHKGHLDIVQSLITAHPNLDHVDAERGTALIHAVSKGRYNIMKVLLDNGADPNVKGNAGMAALMWASTWKNPRMVEVLLEHRADGNLQCDFGRTALMLASQTNRIKAVEILLRKRVDVKIKGNRGETALSLATRAGQVQVAELLVAAGAQSPQ